MNCLPFPSRICEDMGNQMVMNTNGYCGSRWLQRIPKVELHLHLEGAIPLRTLLAFIKRKDGPANCPTLEELQRKFRFRDVNHFFSLWAWKNRFITREEDFESMTYDTLVDLRKQNVRYVEFFFSPGSFLQAGLTTAGIVENMMIGAQQALSEHDILCNFIVDIIRDHGPDAGFQRLEECTPFLGRGIVGVGLGGTEHLYPADDYSAVYAEASSRGFELTAHAGESAGPASIWAAIEKLGVRRIGHGYSAFEDRKLMEYLALEQLHLEICVSSNRRTGLCPSFESHPVRFYYNSGLALSINTDDPTMFGTTLSTEYDILSGKLGFSAKEFMDIGYTSIKAAFLSGPEQERLTGIFDREWALLREQGS